MCGVVGTYQIPYSSYEIRSALHASQNRGQDSSGIGVFDGDLLKTRRLAGVVAQNFTEDICATLPGDLGVGHTRYATARDSMDAVNRQPLFGRVDGVDMAIVHNGNFTNVDQIENGPLRGTTFHTNSDTERFFELIVREHRNQDIFQAIVRALNQMKGSFSGILALPQQLIAIRDPSGNRPLHYGRKEKGYVVASETNALDALGVLEWHEIDPGTILSFNDGRIRAVSMTPTDLNLCSFEWVYNAHPNSVIFGIPVWSIRHRLGEVLAEDYPSHTDLIIGVPDSAIVAAEGFAEAQTRKDDNGVILRRHNTGRTFIMPGQENREKKVDEKFDFRSLVISGKTVTVVDDSLVRGTTSRNITRALRLRGAKEVHWRIASPTTLDSCRYGINTAKKHLLLATQFSLEGMREEIEADSLQFLSLDRFKSVIKEMGGNPRDCCFACMGGPHWA